MNPQQGSFSNDQLQAALAAVWQKSLPLLRQRVELLQSALAELRAGTLSEELRRQAAHEAHRLAGLLGTFGYPEGTDAARLFELAMDSDADLSAPTVQVSEDIQASLESAVNYLQQIVGK